VEGTNEFRLPATFEPQRIRVFDETGYAEVFRQPNEDIGTLTLRPTASISGRLIQAGEPLVGETIYCFPLAQRGLKEARFQEGYTAKTDASGTFRFDRLPPGRYSIRPQLGPWEDSVMTSGESVPVDLQPGDKQEITLGGGPVRLVGNVVTTGNNADKLSKRWSLNYLISRDRGVEYPSDATPLSFDFRGPVQLSWLRQDDFHRWVATRENHFVKLADDGNMVIQGVRPGEYDLVIQLYEQPAGCLVESIGEKVVPVTIAEGEAEVGVVGMDAMIDHVKDLRVHRRVILVPVRRGPRVGSDMRAYKFTDADGQVRMVNDLSGRLVLLDVWASWCQPCLASMPELKAAVEKYADKPLTLVGLNVDKAADVETAQSLAKDGGWSWTQNYLGDESDLMRQLGVSSVPAYYLIGPDGKLVGSANAWEQMETLLGEHLK
jgi:thiol-disulfide isomerase/thioredoxin